MYPRLCLYLDLPGNHLEKASTYVFSGRALSSRPGKDGIVNRTVAIVLVQIQRQKPQLTCHVTFLALTPACVDFARIALHTNDDPDTR